MRRPNDSPSDPVEDLDEDASLVEALTVAGAAVDQAQVMGDIAAHRVVQVVAQAADGVPPLITDIVGPPATTSQRIAADVADAAARYEQARDLHARELEDLNAPASPEARHDLRDIAADSAQAEADATALLEDVDAAEHRLKRRAATPGRGRADLEVSPIATWEGPSEPRLH